MRTLPIELARRNSKIFSLMAEKLRELRVQIYVHIHKNYQQ